ncbi:MAG: 16S rRNA (cytosine(1402)-N(4))-methyltransferase RsmH [Verrucomicrobiota bacterium]|nr:16S rRNA (cytosine(1402)-N(4))-methyltransferase RsmH [Verrucomicrobiota bacterium]
MYPLQNTTYPHTPIMVSQVLEFLDISKRKRIVDCTVGTGGHTEALLATSDSVDVLGIDRDPDALQIAGDRLAKYENRLKLYHGHFSDIEEICRENNWDWIDGILLDAGLSSLQLDSPERGFSFRYSDAPLDMRMNKNDGISAAELLNTIDLKTLTKIFWKFGEEKHGRRLAQFILEARELKPIETTGEFAKIILKAIPFARGKIRSIQARCFQALRIAVNDELEQLKSSLQATTKLLKPGGRIVILSFHSLEDRIVKKFFVEKAKNCTCPHGLPVCCCKTIPELKILTKNIVTASSEEIKKNSRAKPAKLRAAEKLPIEHKRI